MFQTGFGHASNKFEFPESRLYLIKTGFPNNEVFPENQAPTKHQRSRIIRAVKLPHAEVQRIRMKPGIFYNTSHSKACGRLGYTARHMVAWGSITVHTHW